MIQPDNLILNEAVFERYELNEKSGKYDAIETSLSKLMKIEFTQALNEDKALEIQRKYLPLQCFIVPDSLQTKDCCIPDGVTKYAKRLMT